MATVRTLVFFSHPNAVFLSSAFVLATLAFSPQPSFLPIVLSLALIKTYARILIPRPNAIYRSLLLWIVVSAGVTLANLIPSLDALSTPVTSLVVLNLFSALTSFVALAAVFLDARISARINLPWSEITLFPAIWTSLWYLYSYANPIGRLDTWSPILGADGYRWLSRWAGPVALDWIVAAWAVLVYQAVGAWFIGSKEQQEQVDSPHTSDGQLIDHPLHNQEPGDPPVSSRSYGFFSLPVFLTLLALPSVLYNDLPLPTFSPDTTPFSVACVLPIPDKAPLSLNDFLEETRRLNGANLLLWPEGAVRFNNVAERDAAFEQVGRALPGHHIGVGFEEPDPESHGVQPRRRTALALVYWSGSSNSSTEVKMMYYKRHLVPIAESFSLSKSYDPPTIYTLNLSHPRGIPKSRWAPPPYYTRPIPVTASICLDFSHPSAFSALESRPALILAPAQTWHTSIGITMWEQAKARAEEIGSMVLWCDGGRGGVSGIAGMGISEITRVGPGSWTRTIGLGWPMEDSRTVYARGGDIWALFGFAFLASGGWVVKRKNSIQIPRSWFGILGAVGRAGQMTKGWIQGKWRRTSGAGEQQALLG